MRPPAHLVPVPETRWREACAAWGVNALVREVVRDDLLVGWRAPRMWYVEPRAFKQATGFFPPGYCPGFD